MERTSLLERLVACNTTFIHPYPHFAHSIGREIETPQPAVLRAVGPGGVLANHIGPGSRVLDLCCGVGRNSVLLAGKVCPINIISGNMKAQRRNGGHLVQGCDVVGVDMADIALQRARRHWEQAQASQEGQRGSATFMPCDLLAPDTWDGAMLTPFDLVVDTAAFHCFAKACRSSIPLGDG
jgi:SAM-dependent methyltransferase